MKKKISIIGLIITLIAFASVGATLAYLIASSRTVTNTFTVGNIEITLSETSGNQYKMIPGTSVHKNPRVTVKGGSDDCWLFFRLEKSEGFDTYMTYEISDGWFPLEGVENVYYRQMEKTGDDVFVTLLKNNVVTIKDTVTEEMLKELDHNPFLQFTAYAIQKEGNDTAQTAWQNLTEAEEESDR